MSVASSSSLSTSVVMSADELKSFIKSTMRHAEKEVLEAVLVALKSKRKRRTPEEIAADAAKPKRPISEKQKHWNAFVSQVHAEMKEEDPKAKRTDAMKRAKELKAEGKMPAGLTDAEDSDADSDSDAESVAPPPKKAPKAPTKAPAKEKKETAKPAKADKKSAPAPKPTKTAKAAAAPPPESDSEDEAPVPPKPAAKKESPKANILAKPTPPPVTDSDDEFDDDGEALKATTVGNKKVLMSSIGECWEQTPIGGMGVWLGLFDPKTKKIKPAPEPELE